MLQSASPRPIMTTSLVILDERDLFREGIHSIVAGSDDLNVVSSCSDLSAASSAVRQFQPDIVIVGPSKQNNLNGICDELTAFSPAPKVLLLASAQASAHAKQEVVDAIRSGANGCINTTFESHELIDTIRMLARGQNVIPSYVATAALANDHGSNSYAGLSIRELEVLQLMAEGSGNKQIAADLVISEKTVKTHVSHILAKMGESNRTSAILRAGKEGWIQL